MPISAPIRGMFFHLRVAKQLGISFGTVIILTGAAVLLLVDPDPANAGAQHGEQCHRAGTSGGRHAGRPAAAGVDGGAVRCWQERLVLNAIATGMYIGAGFGPGPRDGLMTGLHARTGWSLRGIRTAIEAFRTADWLAAGGKFGVGTRHLRAVDWAADPAVPTVVPASPSAATRSALPEIVS